MFHFPFWFSSFQSICFKIWNGTNFWKRTIWYWDWSQKTALLILPLIINFSKCFNLNRCLKVNVRHKKTNICWTAKLVLELCENALELPFLRTFKILFLLRLLILLYFVLILNSIEWTFLFNFNQKKIKWKVISSSS